MERQPLHIVPCRDGHCISVASEETDAVRAYLKSRGISTSLQRVAVGVDDLILGGDYELTKVEKILQEWKNTAKSGRAKRCT